jgi:hypothetical protein
MLGGYARRRPRSRCALRSSARPSAARTGTSDRALPRFHREPRAREQIVEEPPLITRLNDQDYEAVAEALDNYLATLAPHWRAMVAATR